MPTITRVKSDSNNSGKGTTISLDLGSAPASGNTLVLWYFMDTGTLDPTSVSDGPWDDIASINANGHRLRAYTKVSAGTEQTVDISFTSAASGLGGAMIEYNSTDGELALDVTATNSGTVKTLTSGTITPDATATLKVALFGSEAHSASSAWTNSWTEAMDVNLSSIGIHVAEKFDDGGGSDSTVGTRSVAYDWCCVTASFIPPAGGTPLPVFSSHYLRQMGS